MPDMENMIFATFLFSLYLASRAEVQIVEPRGDIRVERGDDVTVRCVSTHGRHTTWYHNNVMLGHNAKYSIRDVSGDLKNLRVSELQITNVNTGDTGTISCQGTSGHPDSSGSDEITLTVTDHTNIPKIEIVNPVESYLIKELGEEFTLKCIGHVDHRLIWRHNNTILQRGSKLIITNALTEDKSQSLSIISRRSIREHDAGVYECRSDTNALSKDSIEVFVSQGPALNATVTITEPASPHHTLPRGHALSLLCQTFSGTHIDWYRNGVIISTDDDQYEINTVQRNSMNIWSSILSKVSFDEDAVYKCQNRANPRDFDVVEMHIEYTGLQDIENVPRNYESAIMRMGTTLELQCRMESSGIYSSHWHKGTVAVHSNFKFSIRRGRGSSILSIKSTEHNDTGIYRCSFIDEETGQSAGEIVYNVSAIPCPSLEATNHFRPVDCSAHHYVGEHCRIECTSNGGVYRSAHHSVTCQFNPAHNLAYWTDADDICTKKNTKPHRDISSIPTSLSDVLLRAHDDLQLQCGHADVTWVKSENHTPLHNNFKFQIQGGTLTIRNAEKEDADMYICKIKRRDGGILGHKKYNVTVMHCDKPEVPKHGYVTGCSDKPVYGEICQFHCPEGSKLSGSQSRICELNDLQTQTVWTGVKAVCEGASHSSEGLQENEHGKHNSGARNESYKTVLYLWILLCVIYR